MVLALSLLLDEEEKQRTWKRGKTRRWIRTRKDRGYFTNIIDELRIEDTPSYREMMRMDYEQFKEILGAIEQQITKAQVQGGHKVIRPAERLALTLRCLAAGESFSSLHFQFRISKAAVSYIVHEVCHAIYFALGHIYMKVPSTKEEWLKIALEFEEKWQFPNCIGTVDGKHLVIQPPTDSGSHYYNYKHTHSVVLMAVAGPNYECLFADVGTNGRVADGGVWNKCSFLKSQEGGTLGVPDCKPLPFGQESMPYVVVADDAFALRSFVMKPYPQKGLTTERRTYNYRLVIA